MPVQRLAVVPRELQSHAGAPALRFDHHSTYRFATMHELETRSPKQEKATIVRLSWEEGNSRQSLRKEWIFNPSIPPCAKRADEIKGHYPTKRSLQEQKAEISIMKSQRLARHAMNKLCDFFFKQLTVYLFIEFARSRLAKEGLPDLRKELLIGHMQALIEGVWANDATLLSWENHTTRTTIVEWDTFSPCNKERKNKRTKSRSDCLQSKQEATSLCRWWCSMCYLSWNGIDW